jgi:hypothetical protein
MGKGGIGIRTEEAAEWEIWNWVKEKRKRREGFWRRGLGDKSGMERRGGEKKHKKSLEIEEKLMERIGCKYLDICGMVWMVW